VRRVLLTGGGGSIGAMVLDYLLKKTDWEVVILDSFRHKGYKDRIKEIIHNLKPFKDRVTVIQHDLVCPISPHMAERIGKIDYILHLAALSDVFFSIENPVYTIKNNLDSTLTMLEYAKSTKHKAFIYFSTDEVYGPVKKGDAHPEWDTHRPSNAYAASKAASEDICYAYWRSGDVKLIITNTMNNYGIMQSASKFPVMVQKALQNGMRVMIHGNQKEIGTRFYIHSWDTADALVHILTKLPPHIHKTGALDDPNRYHIVGDKAYSNLELARLIARVMDKRLDYELVDFHKNNPAHDIHYGLQDNKLRPNWKPSLTLNEGMKEVITWQSEHEAWM
jgi:dTDP-glucose 4,6-dehydratase